MVGGGRVECRMWARGAADAVGGALADRRYGPLSFLFAVEA